MNKNSLYGTSRSFKIGASTLFLLLVMRPAFGQASCADNFRVSGDPRNGAMYSTFVTIPNIDNHSALGQMEAVALKQEFKVGAEVYSGDEGTLTLVQDGGNSLFKGSPGFPIYVKAKRTANKLSIDFRLNRGQTADASTIRNFVCGMLTSVSMDAQGAAIAKGVRKNTHSDDVEDLTAAALSIKVQKAMKGHSENPSLVEDQFVGHVYQIDGQVFPPSSDRIDFSDLHLTMSYHLPQVGGTLSGLFGRHKGLVVDIVCRTAPDQMEQFKALRNGDFATVIGTITKIVWSTQDTMMQISHPLGEHGTVYLDCRLKDANVAHSIL